MKILLTFAFAMIFAIACLGFTALENDVGSDQFTQASNVTASDTAASTALADLGYAVINRAHRVETAVGVPSEPVPATRFARQQFATEVDLYQSRPMDVEVPPNRQTLTATSNHRAREDV